MKTLAERIKAAIEALTVKKDDLLSLTQQLEQTPDDDTLLEQVSELTTEVEKATKQLDVLQKAEAAMAERAKAHEITGTPGIITSTGNKEDAKELWVKQAVCSFLSHVQRVPVKQVFEERYGKNKALEAVMIQKTAVPIATTFDSGWAAELMRNDVQGFVQLLATQSVAAAMATRSMMLNFDGFDSVTVPSRGPRSATNNLGGAFVGEGGAIPLGRLTIGAKTLSRYKHAVISTFTKELAGRSTPSIEAIIRDAILEDMGVALDSVFLGSGAAVTGVQPAGLANGVTPITGTAGGGVDAIVADIKAAVQALTSAGVGARIVMAMNTNDALSVGLSQTALGEFMFRDEIAQNRLLSFDLIKSLNVPQGTLYVIDAAAIATAFDPTVFETSDQATIVEANADTTAPTHADDGAGAIGTADQVVRNGGIHPSQAANTPNAGYTARSLFQTNSIAIKSWQPVSWGAIQDDAVVIVDSLTW